MNKEELEKLKDIVNKLSDSPIYNMSLGGKELFHSNFWAWLLKKDEKFFNVFFPKVDVQKNFKVLREYNNHDITIFNGEEIYIIENKIKSLPSFEQLDRYEIDILNYLVKNYKKQYGDNYLNAIFALYNRFAEDKKVKLNNDTKKFFNKKKNNLPDNSVLERKYGLLTGLPKNGPDYINNNSPWSYLSYNEISERMKRVCKKSSNLDDFEKKIVEKYCKDIENISTVISELMELNKGKYTFEGVEILEKIRFDDVYKKIKMADFAKTLNNDSRIKEPFQDYSPNKEANLTIRYTAGTDKKYSIGIQIEGYQFRFFVEAPGLANKISNEEDSTILKNLVELEWFANEDKEFFNGKERSGTAKPCNKYKPNFIYQYYAIEKEVSYETLKGEIEKAWEKLLEIVEKHK